MTRVLVAPDKFAGTLSAPEAARAIAAASASASAARSRASLSAASINPRGPSPLSWNDASSIAESARTSLIATM